MACRDPDGAKCSGTQNASATGVMALSESFSKPLVAGNQKVSLASFLHTSAIQVHRRASWLKSYSVDHHVRHLKGHTGWGPTLKFSASRVCWASFSTVQLPMLACGEREALVMAPPSMRDSVVLPCFHCFLAFLNWHFPPRSPPSHPLDSFLHSE